ncbi:FAD/NAD(P)-binding domain containing protein, partial [Trema orientale]
MAVVGGGISGLVSTCDLAQNDVEVVLYEKENHLGGHANMAAFDGLDLDIGFIGFNR